MIAKTSGFMVEQDRVMENGVVREVDGGRERVKGMGK